MGKTARLLQLCRYFVDYLVPGPQHLPANAEGVRKYVMTKEEYLTSSRALAKALWLIGTVATAAALWQAYLISHRHEYSLMLAFVWGIAAGITIIGGIVLVRRRQQTGRVLVLHGTILLVLGVAFVLFR